MAHRLFVVPVINAMGPVTDPRHDDLLSSWAAVDAATSAYFQKDLRQTLVDHRGQPVVFSWFPISWSGFASNPVKRDFGWFTVYDHLADRWGEALKQWGDGIYWMYNHPDASGIGNKWGLDWGHNSHYLNILNRMVLERGFFPEAVQIPTAALDSTHFVEGLFPFELSNRNSPFINWDNVEADGRKTREILQWADAPTHWRPYRACEDNHQEPGLMRHWIFRLLDIKTRIMHFPEEEIHKAFADADSGADVVMAGYEHDFRDRAAAVRDLFLGPIARIAEQYPRVQVTNAAFADAARAVAGLDGPAPIFRLEARQDHWLITSDTGLFSASPYVAMAVEDEFRHLLPTPCGRFSWAIQKAWLPDRFRLGVAGCSRGGRSSTALFRVEEQTVVEEVPQRRIHSRF